MFELTPTGCRVDDPIDFALSAAAAEDARRWWVLHTKPRQEKVLSGELETRNVVHYLPVIETRPSYRSSREFVELPLFQGYLFIFADSDDRVESLKTNRVVSVLNIHDQTMFRLEVSQIRRVIASNEAFTLFPRLRRGAKCRVTTGALKGLVGVVMGTKNRTRLIVSVHALGQAISLEIDAAWLEPISE